MAGYRLTPALALILALFAQSAHAFFDPPWITPEQPRAGETVYVNIRAGVCDGFLSVPGYPKITQEGSSIRMLRYGQHWDSYDTLLCSFPIGTGTFPVGEFPPGSYVLTVELAYVDFFGTPGVLTVGTVPFTVQGTEPAPMMVPASNSVALVALLMLIAGASLMALRGRLAP